MALWQRSRIPNKTNVTRTGSTPAGWNPNRQNSIFTERDTRFRVSPGGRVRISTRISAHREKQAHPVGLAPPPAPPASPPLLDKSQKCLQTLIASASASSVSKPRRCKYRRVPTPYSWTSFESFNPSLSLFVFTPRLCRATAVRLADFLPRKSVLADLPGPVPAVENPWKRI